MPTFSTRDTVLAATLALHGHEPQAITVKDEVGTYTFADVPPDTISDFYMQQLTVEPQTMHRKMRNLISMVKRQQSIGDTK